MIGRFLCRYVDDSAGFASPTASAVEFDGSRSFRRRCSGGSQSIAASADGAERHGRRPQPDGSSGSFVAAGRGRKACRTGLAGQPPLAGRSLSNAGSGIRQQQQQQQHCNNTTDQRQQRQQHHCHQSTPTVGFRRSDNEKQLHLPQVSSSIHPSPH